MHTNHDQRGWQLEQPLAEWAREGRDLRVSFFHPKVSASAGETCVFAAAARPNAAPHCCVDADICASTRREAIGTAGAEACATNARA